VSRSLRHLVKTLPAQGFRASQRVVANPLREMKYSCQANSKTRGGANHPDRDAQFTHINATVKRRLGPVNQRSQWTRRRKSWWAISSRLALGGHGLGLHQNDA
jgi:hypothetical protein